MLKRVFVTGTLAASLMVTTLVPAVELRHPEASSEFAQMEASSGEIGSVTENQRATVSPTDEDNASAPGGMMRGPGMMMGGPDRMGPCAAMMRQMMAGRQAGDGQGADSMGLPMMRAGRGMMAQGPAKKQKPWAGKRQKYRRLMNRMDLIDARLAKIELLLERLLER